MSDTEYSSMDEETEAAHHNTEEEVETEGDEGEEEEEEEEEGVSDSDPQKSPEKTASPALKKKAKTVQAKKPKKSPAMIRAPSSSVTAIKDRPGPSSSSSHPKYEEMILLAIKELKSRSGSSRAAILKVLKENYNLGDNDARIATNVKLALKRGLEKGVFKMAKEEGKGSNSYKLGENANDLLKKPKAKAKTKKDKSEKEKKAAPKPRKEASAVLKKTAKTLSKEKASAKRRSSIGTPST